jgi:hypothetical protein
LKFIVVAVLVSIAARSLIGRLAAPIAFKLARKSFEGDSRRAIEAAKHRVQQHQPGIDADLLLEKSITSAQPIDPSGTNRLIRRLNGAVWVIAIAIGASVAWALD